MCLTILDDYEVKQDYGWKVFWKKEGKLCADLFPHLPYPVNRWIKEKDYRALSGRREYIRFPNTSIRYPMGFHIFLKKKDARGWKNWWNERIRKVKFRKIVAKGWQRGMKVIVAKEMLIIPEKKNRR